MQMHRKHFVLWMCVIVVVCIALWHTVFKPVPEGFDVTGAAHAVAQEDVLFLADATFVTSDGTRHSDQHIFDTIYTMIDEAREFIVLDMFLYNDFLGTVTDAMRPLAQELTERLIAAKHAHPMLTIVVITDPINTVYGGDRSRYFEQLRAVGISVIETNLRQMRDSNPLYSTPWRIALQWWGNSVHGGWLPHAMDVRRGRLTLRSYLRLFNFKANHRKLIVTDAPTRYGARTVRTLITSANPHDGSSAHTNAAVRVDGALGCDVLRSERAIARWSAHSDAFSLPSLCRDGRLDKNVTDAIAVQFLTERAIKDAVLQTIAQTQHHDKIDSAMFYFSDKDIAKALVAAHRRGVDVRVLLDPNKDAFGRAKNGIPNRSMAWYLHRNGIDVRWCDTHGEQCHIKMLLASVDNKQRILITGSANYTRRNLENKNAEADVLVRGHSDARIFTDACAFFAQMWNNKNGRIMSVPYDVYADERRWIALLASVMEYTGLSSF